MTESHPGYRRRGYEPLRHISHIKAQFTPPAPGAPVQDVQLRIEAPGVTVPVTPTRFDRLDPGRRVEVAWRWSPPVRRGREPSSLRIALEATYKRDGERHVVETRATVNIAHPPPPAQDTYLSDLPIAWVVNGYGPVEFDRNNGEAGPGDGGPIRLDGKVYRKGIGMHANGVVGYHLGGNATTLTAVVGIDDSVGNAGSVILRVVGDGRTLYDSGLITGATRAEPISVDVSGVDDLELVADATRDGQPHDWVNWADAFLKIKH